jgi:hypothetical protein
VTKRAVKTKRRAAAMLAKFAELIPFHEPTPFSCTHLSPRRTNQPPLRMPMCLLLLTDK